MTSREHDERNRIVHAFVGVSEGRLCVNMSWYYLQGEDHWELLAVMFGPSGAGFFVPRALDYEHNKPRMDGSYGVNWNRLRISSEQFDMAELDVYDAAKRVRTWMRGMEPWSRFRLNFKVGHYSPRSRVNVDLV
jgi:hypothetical protein